MEHPSTKLIIFASTSLPQELVYMFLFWRYPTRPRKLVDEDLELCGSLTKHRFLCCSVMFSISGRMQLSQSLLPGIVLWYTCIYRIPNSFCFVIYRYYLYIIVYIYI